MRVSFQNGVFICHCDFSQRGDAEAAGFLYNPISKRRETTKLSKAVRLREYFDESAENRIQCNSVQFSPWPGRLLTPRGKTLKEYQKRGAKFILDRNHSYIAFEQGLGKSATAITAINSLGVPTLIICPPFLVENWKREIGEWGINIEAPERFRAQITVLADTLLDRPSVHEFLSGQDFGFLVVDEAHRFKNFEAKRSQNLFKKITGRIPRVTCLSGTPMPNRPIELFPVLSSLAHDTIDFMSAHEFAVQYCNAFENRFGWDYTGACNLSDLQNRISPSFLYRETKDKVMPELDPKVERVVVLTSNSIKAETLRMEKTLLRKYGTTSNIVAKETLGEIASYRKEIGVLKIPMITEYVKDILDTSQEKLLILAWHTEVIEKLALKFKDFEVITGSTPVKQRQLIIDKFQKGKTRGIIAQIKTMVGYNLTMATRAIFAEYSWSPADNDQAADRIHRIGQTNSVTIDYLALAKTIDVDVLDSLLTKRNNINRVINKGAI